MTVAVSLLDVYILPEYVLNVKYKFGQIVNALVRPALTRAEIIHIIYYKVYCLWAVENSVEMWKTCGKVLGEFEKIKKPVENSVENFFNF